MLYGHVAEGPKGNVENCSKKKIHFTTLIHLVYSEEMGRGCCLQRFQVPCKGHQDRDTREKRNARCKVIAVSERSWVFPASQTSPFKEKWVPVVVVSSFKARLGFLSAGRGTKEEPL